MSSDYVVDKEIAIIRERQGKGEAVHFYPIVLTPTPKWGLRLVSDKNSRPPDGKPLSDYSLHERYRQMAEVADEIAAMAQETTEQEDEQEPPAWPRIRCNAQNRVRNKRRRNRSGLGWTRKDARWQSPSPRGRL